MLKSTTEWLVENHLIFTKIYEIDNEGIVHVIEEMNNMVSTSTLPLVHIIVDLNDTSKYPNNINQIAPRIRSLFSNDRLGWYIHLTDNQILGFLVQVSTSMYRVRARTFKTKAEALTFLQEKDATLPDLH